MKAADAMTRKVICIHPEDSLEDAHALMTEWTIRHLPVVDEGVVVGILSDRDVLRVMQVDGEVERVPALLAGDVMHRRPHHCVPTSSISYIAGLMVDHKIDALPVLDAEGRLVGLVTSSDLLELLREKEGDHKVLPFRFEVHSDVIRRRASA
jgi:CBS domain-containing protein